MRDSRIEIPRVVEVTHGCRDHLAELLAGSFDTELVLVGCGCGPSLSHAEEVVEALRRAGTRTELRSGLEGRLTQAADLAADAIRSGATVLVGVGGGRVI